MLVKLCIAYSSAVLNWNVSIWMISSYVDAWDVCDGILKSNVREVNVQFKTIFSNKGKIIWIIISGSSDNVECLGIVTCEDLVAVYSKNRLADYNWLEAH